MAERTLFIPLPMPNLNDLIGAALSHRTAYSRLKKKWGGIVALYARSQGFEALRGPAHFEFEFTEPNRRRDPDNFVSGGIKVIFDALQEAQLLENDGWNHVLSVAATWRANKERPGVRLTVHEQSIAPSAPTRRKLSSEVASAARGAVESATRPAATDLVARSSKLVGPRRSRDAE